MRCRSVAVRAITEWLWRLIDDWRTCHLDVHLCPIETNQPFLDEWRWLAEFENSPQTLPRSFVEFPGQKFERRTAKNLLRLAAPRSASPARLANTNFSSRMTKWHRDSAQPDCGSELRCGQLRREGLARRPRALPNPAFSWSDMRIASAASALFDIRYRIRVFTLSSRKDRGELRRLLFPRDNADFDSFEPRRFKPAM
jgi:hypothetical protein